MAISAGFVMLLLLFFPVLTDSVTKAGNNTTAFNATEPLATSVIELSAFPVLALAAGFMLMVLRRSM
jgi:hypothetical protein